MTSNELIKIGEDDAAEYFNGLFQGKKVGFRKDKTTGDLTLNQNDVANVLGFKNADDMMHFALTDPKVPAALKTAANLHFTQRYENMFDGADNTKN